MKTALEGTDTAEIKQAAEDLQNLFHAAAQQMYQATADSGDGSGPGPGAGEAGGNSEDAEKKKGSVDADFEVVED